MSKKNFDVSKCKIRRFINDVPIEEYPEEERERLFEQMLIKAVHSIGLVFEDELPELNSGQRVNNNKLTC